jgi:hypothetical protein
MKYQLVVRGTLKEAVASLTQAVPGAEVISHEYRLPFNETIVVIEVKESAALLLNKWLTQSIRSIGSALGALSYWRGIN